MSVTAPPAPSSSGRRTGRWIDDWRPEDAEFWESEGAPVARRNLIWSIFAEHLGFSVWLFWSVSAALLVQVGFDFSVGQLFLLVAIPNLVGSLLRLPYTFAVPKFGGRNWTVISALLLLGPTLLFAVAVQNPETPYWAFVLIAATAGVGGGNFASSMANISFFFPRDRKGSALGLNAGLGNLGVSVVQFVVPLAITGGVFGALGGDPQSVAAAGATQQIWLQNAGFVWVPFIVASTVAAWFGMNDIAEAKASFADQAVIFKRKHNWLMCWLYMGTFGSFIGYSAGFPLLIKSQFPEVNALAYAFLGPLVGAVIRPVGGWLSDKVGGAPVTFWNFIAMALAVLGVLWFLPSGGSGGNFYGFLAAFMLLFALAGIGNGSTFRMIPIIFLTERQRETRGMGTAAREQAIRDGNKEAAAVLGFSSAIGAYGGFFIPKSYGSSIALTGGPEAALYLFIVFYVTCIALTWWYYARRGAEMPC